MDSVVVALGASLLVLAAVVALLVRRVRRLDGEAPGAAGRSDIAATARPLGPVTRSVTDGGDREPKLVMAYIRPDRLEAVKEALAEVGAPSLTVTQGSGRGSQPATKGQWRGETYTVDLRRTVKVECVVADTPVDDVVAAIADGAHTGEPGDGKVFVLPVERALQIRTGKRGSDAV